MNYNKFETWINTIADIPMKDKSGIWYDAETGLTFADYLANEEKEPRKEVSSKTKEERTKAKKFGGKALRGTIKQKTWAESIRADKLSKITCEQQKIILSTGSIFQHAKFWIENRNDNDLGTKSLTALTLIKKINHFLRKAEKSLIIDKYRVIVCRKDHDLIMSERDKEIDNLKNLFSKESFYIE